MHVHVHDTDELPLYIANGVTGIRIMAGERDTSARRTELGRESPSPEIYLASAIVDGDPPIWPGSIVVKKATDARRTVDEIKAGGADFVKVYNHIPRDAYFAIADESKQQHIPFEGHVPDAITAQEASAAWPTSTTLLRSKQSGWRESASSGKPWLRCSRPPGKRQNISWWGAADGERYP